MKLFFLLGLFFITSPVANCKRVVDEQTQTYVWVAPSGTTCAKMVKRDPSGNPNANWYVVIKSVHQSEVFRTQNEAEQWVEKTYCKSDDQIWKFVK